MKIVEETFDSLVLLHRPVVRSATLVAGTLLLIYFGIENFARGETEKAIGCWAIALVVMGPWLWLAVERVDVVFDATQNRCTIRTRHWSREDTQMHKLSSILRATSQTRLSTELREEKHRVALVIGTEAREDQHGLTRLYASGTQTAATVARINNWLSLHRR